MRSILCVFLGLLGLAPSAGAQALQDSGQPPAAIAADNRNLDVSLQRLLDEYQQYMASKDAMATVTGHRRVETSLSNGPLCVSTMPPTPQDARGVPQPYSWINRDQPIWGRATGGTLPYSWTWEFGDGSPPVHGVASTIAEANNIATSHQYATSGVKRATLTVTDGNGAVASRQVRIDVVGCANQSGEGRDARTNGAIEDGLRWLYLNQMADGRWGNYGNANYDIATTGAALLTFHLRQHFRGHDPCEDIYQGTVASATDYLLSRVVRTPVASGSYPDVSGDGFLDAFGTGGHSGYSHGLAMMGLCASDSGDLEYVAPSGGASGSSLRAILENAMDQCYHAQSKSGWSRGGWRYSIDGDNFQADNSVTQWPVLGLLAAQQAGIAPVAGPCLTDLRFWTDYSQCSDGGFGYTAPNNWCNIAKTGAGILELWLLRDRRENSRVQAALDFIDRNWSTDGEHLNSLYALYAVAKGCREMRDALDLPVKQIGSRDWYMFYRDHIERWPSECVSTPPPFSPLRQNADGSWPDGLWMASGGPTATAFALLVLIPAVIEYRSIAVGSADRSLIACDDVPITFNGTASYSQHPDRRIIEWCWDFDASDGVDWNNPDACGAEVNFAGYGVLPPGVTVKVVTLRVKDDTPPPLGPKVGYDEVRITLDNQTNHAPVACLRPNCAQQPAYSGQVGKPICFDGSWSFDPDACRGDGVACYEWDLDGDGEYDDGTGVTICYTWNEEYTGRVGLRVCDTHGAYSENDIAVNVYVSRKNLKITQVSMVPMCGYPCELTTVTMHADVQLETEGGGQTTMPGTTVEFWDGDRNAGGVFIGARAIPGGAYGPQVFGVDQTWNIAMSPVQHTIHIYVDPGDNVPEWNEETDNDTAWVQPPANDPPDCSQAAAQTVELWPPNHRLEEVQIIGVTDPQNDPFTIRVTGITQDEPLNGPGDGSTCPDAVIMDGKPFIRVERSGQGNGRVYTITFVADDGLPNGVSSPCSVEVCVPHDRKDSCVKDAVVVNSLEKQCTWTAEEEESVRELGITRAEVNGTVGLIEYGLPADAQVSLAVYDLAGRMVVRLENAPRPAGQHQATFNTAGLPGGVYFCRLRVGSTTLTRSLLLVK